MTNTSMVTEALYDRVLSNHMILLTLIEHRRNERRNEDASRVSWVSVLGNRLTPKDLRFPQVIRYIQG